MYLKIILFLFFAQIAYADPVQYFDIIIPEKYYDNLITYCAENKVPVIYVARLIKWESNWDALCVTGNKNKTKDYGLMKHNSVSIPDFIKLYNNNIKYDPLDAQTNLKIGIKHLAYLRKQTGSWFGALAAYNMGLRGFSEWRKNMRIMPEETKKELEFIFG